MERSDERLSTRDLASGSGSGTDADDERDTALADQPDSPPADTGAVRADRVDDDDRAAMEMDRGDREREGDGGMTGDAGAGDAPYDRDVATAGGDRETTADGIADSDATAAADTGDRDRDSTATGDADAGAGQLLAESDDYQRRWEQIQGRFVDEPRGAVEDADALVATVMQQLAEGFAVERERLEAQWGRGEDISTEDLRVSLQRYRSFFQRLLST